MPNFLPDCLTQRIKAPGSAPAAKQAVDSMAAVLASAEAKLKEANDALRLAAAQAEKAVDSAGVGNRLGGHKVRGLMAEAIGGAGRALSKIVDAHVALEEIRLAAGMPGAGSGSGSGAVRPADAGGGK